MAKINLLPWRDEHRAEKKREYLSVLLFVGILAGIASFVWYTAVSDQLDNQRDRNELLKTEIAKLDKKVKEIRELQARRQEISDRMRVIQDLQGNRPVIVRVFDEMVRSVPDGVFLDTIKRTGDVLAIKGSAESNNRVSALMRRFDESDWFSNPNLMGVVADPTFGEQANTFDLQVGLNKPQQNSDGNEG